MTSANAVTAAPVRTQVHELDSRVSDAIRVQLLWDQGADRITVAVDDAKTGEAFTIDVRDYERPLDVFHHPYAYAAVHGIETHPTERAA
jgi:hypothetical protein